MWVVELGIAEGYQDLYRQEQWREESAGWPGKQLLPVTV